MVPTSKVGWLCWTRTRTDVLEASSYAQGFRAEAADSTATVTNATLRRAGKYCALLVEWTLLSPKTLELQPTKTKERLPIAPQFTPLKNHVIPGKSVIR